MSSQIPKQISAGSHSKACGFYLVKFTWVMFESVMLSVMTLHNHKHKIRVSQLQLCSFTFCHSEMELYSVYCFV